MSKTKAVQKKKENKAGKAGIIAALLLILAGVGVGVYAYNTNSKSASDAAVAEKEREEDHEDYEEPENEKSIKVIEITANGFNPSRLTVEPNESIVAFINKDTMAHTVVADQIDQTGANTFNTGAIAPGDQISAIEYSEPGTYTYYSESSPNVKGTIIVEE